MTTVFIGRRFRARACLRRRDGGWSATAASGGRLRRHSLVGVLLLVTGISFVACNISTGSGPYPVQDLTISAPASQESSRSILPVPQDVDRVEARIVGEDRYGIPHDPLVTANLSLVGGVWQAVVPDLPVGPALEITLTGYDAESAEIYEGFASVVLSPGENYVTVPLHPVRDPQYAIAFPIIESVTRPAAVEADSRTPVTIVIRGSAAEELEVALTSNLGSFDPPAMTVTTNMNGYVSCTSYYLAPSQRGSDAGTVRVENSQGNSVDISFDLEVISEVSEASFTTAFAPSIVSVAGSRAGDSVFWYLETADDHPVGELSFDWSFDQTVGSDGAVFAAVVGPEGELTGYDESVGGVVSVSVGDGDGLTTTVSFDLFAGQFADVAVLDAISGANDAIAFVSYRGSQQDIWVVDADGRNAMQVTRSDDDETEPAWSPDGFEIVYVSRRSAEEELFIVDANGEATQQVTSDALDKSQPAWSPDGTRIAYRADVGLYGTDYDIFVVDADGSNPRTLAHTTDDESQPAWSPDGSRIAFIRSWQTGTFPDTTFESEIFVVNADGAGETQLTFDRGPQTFTWSPDGLHIAFDAFVDGTREIVVMDADGSNQTRITFSPFSEYHPRWSRDGSRIACWSWDVDWGQPMELWEKHISVVDATGDNYRQVSFGVSVQTEPVWSPDSTRIAFTGHPDPADIALPEEVYIVAADGSYQRIVTDDAASDRDPDWSP